MNMKFEEFRYKMKREQPDLSDEQIADIYDHSAMTNGRLASGPPIEVDFECSKEWGDMDND